MAKIFDKGVSYYTRAKTTVEASFPENDICCHWCRFNLRDRYDNSRQLCIITGEMLYAPMYTVGAGCPLVIEGEEK